MVKNAKDMAVERLSHFGSSPSIQGYN